MITPESVKLAYRFFLGREPESENVINSLCQNTHSIEELRAAFLKSPEFIQGISEYIGKPQTVRQRHPFHLPRIPVETEVSDEVLASMFERIHQEWEHLGKTEPYWSVVTQPKYYQADFTSHSDEFYLSGKHVAQLFTTALRRNGIDQTKLKNCLDLGCGVGRVTVHLTDSFEKVIGADISAAHLAIAEEYSRDKQITGIEWQQWQSLNQIRNMPEVDAIHSLITFQHNPPPIIVWILKTVLSYLKQGGVAFFQIPTYKTGYMFEVERYIHSSQTNTMEMHFLPQHEVFKVISEANCRMIEMREDAMVGSEHTMLSNTFLVQKNT
jgi:2-polyprenyl-3-methyl-5-hydroxy-6-metoxy-1,4-benzoquinol methylase